MVYFSVKGFVGLNRIINERLDPGGKRRRKGRAMRTEQEVNCAVEQYSDMILRLCNVSLKNLQDAEDVLQTVFLKYALSRVEFESAEHEKAWLIRVASNQCKDVLRNVFRRRTVSLEEADLPGAAPEQPDVLEAVRALPRAYREVIYLHFYEGYTAPEIAKILGKNPNTIYTHLYRAKAMLKDALGGEGDGT